MKLLTVNARNIRANHRDGDDALPTIRVYPDVERGDFLEVHAVEWCGASEMRFTHQNAGGAGVPGASTVEVSIRTDGGIRAYDRAGAVVLELEDG